MPSALRANAALKIFATLSDYAGLFNDFCGERQNPPAERKGGRFERSSRLYLNIALQCRSYSPLSLSFSFT